MWWIIIGFSAVVAVAVVLAVIAYRKREIAENEQHYAQPPAVEQDDDDDEELPVANAEGFRTGYAAALRVVNEDEDDYPAVNLVRNPEDRPGGQIYHRQVTMIDQQPQPPVLPDFNFDGIPDVFEQPAPVDTTPAPDPTPAYEFPAPQPDTYCPPTPDPTPSYDPTPSAPAPDYCPAPDPTPSGNDYGGTSSTDYGNTGNDYGNSGWLDSEMRRASPLPLAGHPRSAPLKACCVG
jgi:hypothetical protein